MMHNNEQMIKPEQDSKVEKPHLLLSWIEKERKNIICIIHYNWLNTMEENITVIKTTMGVLAKAR